MTFKLEPYPPRPNRDRYMWGAVVCMFVAAVAFCKGDFWVGLILVVLFSILVGIA